MRWQAGILAPFKQTGAPFAAIGREAEAEEVFLRGLDQLTAQNITVSHSSHSGNFAPKKIAEKAVGKGFRATELKNAMNRLLDAGAIKVVFWGRTGDRRSRLLRDGLTLDKSGTVIAEGPVEVDEMTAEAVG